MAARPWFRLSSMARPAGAPTPAPAPAPAPVATPAPAPLVRPTVRPLAPPPAEPTPPPPAPLARPTLRPLAPPPAEPTPPPAAAPTPTPPPAAAPTPMPPPVAAPTSTPPAPLVRPTLRPLAPPPAESTPPPPATRVPTPSPAAIAPPPSVVTTTTASVPSSPARGVSSAPSAASPPATAIAITSTSSSVPPSPRTTVTTSVPNFAATSRAVPPPQTSPPKPTATAYSVPQQAYSPPKPRSTIISLASTAREPNPNDKPSLRTIRPANHTPPESPNRLKPTAPPPSPLNLPASQLKSRTADQRIPLEAEQKTVLVQKTIDQKSNSWFSTGGSKQDRESGKPGIHAHIAKQEDKIIRKKLSSDSEEAPGMRVITLAGENKGAHMELIRSPNKHHEQRGEHSHYLYKKGNNGKVTQTVGNHESDKSYSSSSGEEGKAKMKDKIHHRGNKAGQSSQLPLSSFTNSNVQGINNSIMYNTSCTHHDPGVHIALARKPNGDGFDVKSHVNGRNS